MNDLKDIILSTLAEIDDVADVKQNITVENRENTNKSAKTVPTKKSKENSTSEVNQGNEISDDEIIFLKNVRERLLVLFEGFQSPNNKTIEAKVDLTLNFLEYLLATIDERINNEKVKN